jgi:hypothetical protein
MELHIAERKIVVNHREEWRKCPAAVK